MNVEDLNSSPNHRNDTQPFNPPDSLGPLRGQVWLTIQTHQAQQLIRGRNGTPDKPPIIGLVGFADRLRVIWLAARNNDPYADWWLIKVHGAIEASGDTLRNWQKEMDDLLLQQSAMEITIAGSVRPYRMPLQFANPYAYQGANLLSEYDRLVRTALTARHVGLLDSKIVNGLIQASAGKIRSLFAIPQGYRFLGVNRESMQMANEKSHKARQAMGEVPEDVMSGERHAPIVPRKVTFPTRFAENVDLHSASPTSNQNLSEIENDNS